MRSVQLPEASTPSASPSLGKLREVNDPKDVISLAGRIPARDENFTKTGPPGKVLSMADKRENKRSKDLIREIVDEAVRDELAKVYLAEADKLREQIGEQKAWINGLEAQITALQEQVKRRQENEKAALDSRHDVAEALRASLRRLLRGCREGWEVAQLRDAIEAILGEPPTDPDGDED